jgi:hypothetical protein
MPELITLELLPEEQESIPEFEDAAAITDCGNAWTL